MSAADVKTILAVDPSATCTGYAVFRGRTLVRVSTLTPAATHDVYARMMDIADAIQRIAEESSVVEVVVEMPGKYVIPGRPALPVYCVAAGVFLERLRAVVGSGSVFAATPSQWMVGMMKKDQRLRIARGLWPRVAWPRPTGRVKKNHNSDAADAALLGWWFLDARDRATRVG